MAATALFADIFRRADKNDDEQLSLEEFKAFVGVDELSDEDYHQLFNTIDADHSGGIETSELAAFFQAKWGPFEHLFNDCASMNGSLTKCLQHTFEISQSGSAQDKAMARLFIREVAQHLSHVESALESAYKALEPEGASTSSSDVVHVVEDALHRAGDYAMEVEHQISDAVHRVAERLEARLHSSQADSQAPVWVATAALVLSCATAVYLVHARQ
eukprot:m.81822 g.81822  ORF g.81822 m.81822 type:complete len:216 (+) comp14582_c0_seq1:56-703(+)